MWFLYLLLTPVLVILFFELKYYKDKKSLNHLRGPPALPVLGNVHQLGTSPSEILENLFDWWKKYGKNYRLWVGYFGTIVVSAPKEIEFILTSNSFIKKSDVYEMLYPWLGTGLLTSSGTKWHKHRKMITPSFHFKILQNFHEVINARSNQFIELLRKTSDDNAIFDIQEPVKYVTLDIICDTAMGVNIDAMNDNDSKIVTAFRDMCYNANMRTYHPLKRKNSWYKFFPDYKQYRKTLKILQDFTNDVIEKRITMLENSTNETIDDEFSRKKLVFLDTLLSATVDDRPLNRQELYEEVSTFIFAGHDTTSSSVAFTIFLLSRHPEIQEKVLAEQEHIMGENLKRNATFQEISEMKYLDLVIKETMRLYPSVPIVGRSADQDYNMNGIPVPKNTTMFLFIMAMGYNEDIYPDPYRCDPDRFDIDKSHNKQNAFDFVPFSAGPRNCIGQKFAMLELKTVISKVVRYFEILPALDELVSKDGYVDHVFGLGPEERKQRLENNHKYRPILSAELTLKSENGLHIRLRERK